MTETPRLPYRVGHHNGRNIYRVDLYSDNHLEDQHIGVMFTPGDAQLMVDAINSVYSRLATYSPDDS